MRIIVPFDAQDPNTRLASQLDAEKRYEFARTMLRDVLDTIISTGHEPTVLATGPVETEEADVIIDERSLNPAVNAFLGQTAERVGIIMSDLPLMTETALHRLLASTSEVALAPGRGGGTNALLVDHGEFRVDYHGVSYLDHLTIANEVDASVEVIDSFQLAVDIDRPADFGEVLIHGDCRTHDWLSDEGFELCRSDGRVEVRRCRYTNS